MTDNFEKWIKNMEEEEFIYLIVYRSDMVAYRCKHEIRKEILYKCKTPTKRTHIMYWCRLSPNQLKQHLDVLVEMGFIHHMGATYFTTAKGRAYFRMLDSI